MNMRKMIAIIFIWMVAAGGWVFLGGTVMVRTEGLLDSDRRVAKGVDALWGQPQVQSEPVVRVSGSDESQQFTRSEVTVLIDAQNRKRGLGWFPVYDIRFTGVYTVTNETDQAQRYEVSFARPESNAEFLEQRVAVDDKALPHRQQIKALPHWQQIVETPLLEPGKSSTVTFSYHSKGTKHWTYDLPNDAMVSDATITVRINEADYDFGLDGSPPDDRAMQSGADERYELVWRKTRVTNARDVTILMPTRDQPGHLVSRISFFAPVGLFFFFIVMIAIGIVKKLELHPMHYLFLAAAFFAFHLLMAYMVDHVELHASFWISSAVSVLLLVMYLWLVAGPKTAILYAGLSQLVYLVLFSYSFFLENFTGLTVTIGAVMTLAVLMVLTAKVRWGETMPELERKRASGWTPVADTVAAPPAADGKDAPGFIGEKDTNGNG